MRRLGAIAITALVLALAGPTSGWSQAGPPPGGGGDRVTVVTTTGTSLLTPLAFYAAGGIVCSAVSPMIGTVILGREMTGAEVGRSTLNCFLGPVGWVVGPMLFPDVPLVTNTPPPRGPPSRTAQPSRGGRSINIPPPGETRFVPDEVLVTVNGDADAVQQIATSFDLQVRSQRQSRLLGSTLVRFGITDGRPVGVVLAQLAADGRTQRREPNHIYSLQQAAGIVNYAFDRIALDASQASGENVRVAVIDTGIDDTNPALAGVIADQYDAMPNVPIEKRDHGTSVDGLIAGVGPLEGMAPGARIYHARAFEGGKSTMDVILSALDWALAQNRDPHSPLHGKLDPGAIAISGFSCGGLQALQIAGDPRVKTLIVMNSGIFNDSTQGITGVEVSKSLLDRIHTPTLYILGGETDIAYANGMDDFRRIKHVPAYVANLVGVGHGGSYWDPNGGKAAAAVVAWLDWQLRGDKKAKKMFVGKDCGLCRDPAWQLTASQSGGR